MLDFRLSYFYIRSFNYTKEGLSSKIGKYIKENSLMRGVTFFDDKTKEDKVSLMFCEIDKFSFVFFTNYDQSLDLPYDIIEVDINDLTAPIFDHIEPDSFLSAGRWLNENNDARVDYLRQIIKVDLGSRIVSFSDPMKSMCKLKNSFPKLSIEDITKAIETKDELDDIEEELDDEEALAHGIRRLEELKETNIKAFVSILNLLDSLD